ncbi:MAG TPA: FUSC family protein [Nocardioidaceae bacterium]|jgi:hypothetical protein|nr:FUSC family protein [Nocardioidaceae bacterium]
MRSAGDVVARPLKAAQERFRRGGVPALGWALRLTAAATAAYVTALALFPDTKPLLAPLTALLVVQLTPVSLLASGADRVLSVVIGVSVAALFATVVDLTWWSLAIMIAVSILIGQVLRIAANLIEVPISAMLVLGVGSLAADSAAWQRFSETLVGAGVGVASNLLFPPKVGAQDAGRAIEGLGKDLADLLDRAGDQLADEDADSSSLRESALAWLDEARRLTHGIPEVGTALLRAEESRRLNLRAAGTVDPGPGLRQGLEALEHSAVAIRSMFRSIVDTTEAFADSESSVGPELRSAVALALHEFAAAVRAFARLVGADARPGETHVSEDQRARDAVQELGEARARVTEFLLVDDDPVRAELNFALLATIKRLLAELDLDVRARRQRLARQPALLRNVRRRTLRPGTRQR